MLIMTWQAEREIDAYEEVPGFRLAPRDVAGIICQALERGAAAGTAAAVAAAMGQPIRPRLHAMVGAAGAAAAGAAAAVQEEDLHATGQPLSRLEAIAAREATERGMDTPMRRIMRLQVRYQGSPWQIMLTTS